MLGGMGNHRHFDLASLDETSRPDLEHRLMKVALTPARSPKGRQAIGPEPPDAAAGLIQPPPETRCGILKTSDDASAGIDMATL